MQSCRSRTTWAGETEAQSVRPFPVADVRVISMREGRIFLPLRQRGHGRKAARPQGHKATRVGVKQVTHLVYPGNGLSIRTHLLFEVTVKAILLRRTWWASPCCLHLKKTSANRNSLGSKLPFHIPTILSARTLNQMSSFHSPSELFASCGTGNNQNIRWWP